MTAFELRWVPGDWGGKPQADRLRNDVLLVPFGVGPIEWHDADPVSLHLVAIAEDEVVGYSRLILQRGTAQLRQVCVAFDVQGSGIGRALMEETLRKARELGLPQVWLNARTHAVGFYERLGFRVTSGAFHEGMTTLPHVRMELEL